MTNDPRKAGFNYGAALGAPKGNAVYDLAMAKEHVLARKAEQASEAAWSLDMAIRDVRHATTASEQSAALAKLAQFI